MNPITPTPSTRDIVISVVAVLLSLGFFGLGLASSYVYPTLSPIFIVGSTVGGLFLTFLQVFPRFTIPVLHFRLVAKWALIPICLLSIFLNVFLLTSKENFFNHPISNTTATSISTAASLSPTSSSIATSAPTPTTESNSSTVLARKLPYNADWSKGSDGWMDGTDIGGWSISNGMLNNSGSAISNPVLLAPQIQSPSTNYTVSADIQYSNTFGDYAFGIIVGSDGGSDGYACYLTGSKNQSINIVIVNNSNNSLIWGPQTTLASLNELVEDTSVHTYHVKVSEAQIIFWIDTGKQIVFQMPTNNNLSLQKTYVGLIDNYGVISVNNFKVTAS